MEKSKNYDEFVKAFNNFDSRPLSGENLKKFYLDDFTKQSVEDIDQELVEEDAIKYVINKSGGCLQAGNCG